MLTFWIQPTQASWYDFRSSVSSWNGFRHESGSHVLLGSGTWDVVPQSDAFNLQYRSYGC